MSFTLVNNVSGVVQTQSNTGATTIVLQTGQGAAFASATVAYPIHCGVFDTSTSPETLKFYCDVTGVTGDTLTVANRGAESTTDANALVGYTVAAVVTADVLNSRNRWAVLPSGWDAGWKASKAAAKTGSTAWILANGDSVVAGQGSTDYLNNGWVGKLRAAMLAAGVPLYGDFFPAWTYNLGTNPAAQGSVPFSTPPAATIYEAGLGRVIVPGSTGTAFTTFTTPRNDVVGMDIVYVDYATGSFQYSVDGGGNVTVNTTGPGTQAGAILKRVQITGLTAGTHTLAIGNAATTANALMLCGVSTYSGTSGVGWVRNGYPTMAGVDLCTAAGTNTGAGGGASFPPDKARLIEGSTYAGINFTGFPVQPHLAIDAFLLNDCTYGCAPQAVARAMKRRIQAYRRGRDACSILFLAPSYPDGQNSDVAPGGRGPTYYLYKQEMAKMAAAHGCAFVDIDAKWAETGFAKGFQANNDLHPLDAGHNDIASVLAGIL